MKRKSDLTRGQGTLNSELRGALHSAGYQAGFETVYSQRFWSSVQKPCMLLRTGWRLCMETSQAGTLVYRLGDPPRVGQRMFASPGQTILLDRTAQMAILLTYARGEAQEIRVDLRRRKVWQDNWLLG